MINSNGSNTTAAAAILAAQERGSLQGRTALVLGGTGPVGVRAAQLLVREGARVRLASRSSERRRRPPRWRRPSPAQIATGMSTATPSDVAAACEGVEVIIAAGSRGPGCSRPNSGGRSPRSKWPSISTRFRRRA